MLILYTPPGDIQPLTSSRKHTDANTIDVELSMHDFVRAVLSRLNMTFATSKYIYVSNHYVIIVCVDKSTSGISCAILSGYTVTWICFL